MDKLITIEAAAAAVQPGQTLALGGLTLYRRPMAFVRALVRRQLKLPEFLNLSLVTFTASLESDLLVGARAVAQVRTCYFGLEIFGLAPMFTYFANQGVLEVLEESETSLAFGLRAAMAGVGFMPGRGWVGTDLLKLRPDVHTIIDPYSGENLVAFPAILPDVAVIHALKADLDGNALIGANKGIDEELATVSRLVIITAEEIVPKLVGADITAPYVHMVCHAPQGALPSSCHPLYAMDGETILAYSEKVSDPETFRVFLAEWLG